MDNSVSKRKEEKAVFLENALLFTRLLRQVGLPVSLEQSMNFVRSLTFIDIGQREHVFHAARSLLVTQHQHLNLFTTVFNRFWNSHKSPPYGRGQKTPVAPRHKRQRKRFDIVTYMAYQSRETDEEIDIADRSGSFSPTEVIRHKEFSEMTAEELETVKRLIQEMRWKVALRRTNRRILDSRGRTLDLRRAMRSAAKYQGLPLDLFWLNKKIKQRPLVFIADISGSMEKYSRLMLQLSFSITHSLRQVECFVFGTRLTRITHQLKLKNIDRAVSEASHQVVDWSGGTRIGECLKTFNHEWSRRVLQRGAVVLIISDGWERGDTATLSQEMRYLQRRCHRLIWLNPLLGKETYQPLVGGMAVALPYIDDFLPVHNFQSLLTLSQHLSKLGPHRTVRRSNR